MHVGVAHHLGWAVLVTASDDHHVVDRRRVDLVADDLPAAPVHHEGGAHPMHSSGDPLPDDALAALVDRVSSSIVEHATLALDELEQTLTEPVRSLSVRAWPDFPEDIAERRRPPYEAKVDAAMYCDVLAEVAAARGWDVHRFDAKDVLGRAAEILGDDADEVLQGPKRRLGPPWAKDHRVALAATVVAVAAPR